MTSLERRSAPPVVILAGGLGRRMGGGDKPLTLVGGRPMLNHVIDRLRPQTEAIAINANGDPGRFSAYGLPVIEDTIQGYAGPLAGILSGMLWTAARYPEADVVVSVAADTPFFPSTLVAELIEALNNDDGAIAIGASANGVHPVFAAWPVALAEDLAAFLAGGYGGKILAFIDQHRRIDVVFEQICLPDGTQFDPFYNVNTPHDAARAEAIATNFGR